MTEAIATVTEVMFVSTWLYIVHRFDVCKAANGAHTETYWVTTLSFVLLNCDITSCV
jgi:hypothetical protein